MGSINFFKPTFLSQQHQNKFLGMLRLEHGVAGWEARMLPLCYPAPLSSVPCFYRMSSLVKMEAGDPFVALSVTPQTDSNEANTIPPIRYFPAKTSAVWKIFWDSYEIFGIFCFFLVFVILRMKMVFIGVKNKMSFRLFWWTEAWLNLVSSNISCFW